MSGTRRKARARAERSQRMVSVLVLATIWLGMIVLLIIPARREHNDAKQLADTAAKSLKQTQADADSQPKVAVSRGQQAALAKALPDQFVLGAVENDIKRRASALKLTVATVRQSGDPARAGDLETWTVEATVRGPLAGVEDLLRGMEANAAVDSGAGIVDVRSGMLLTLRRASISVDGNTAEAQLTLLSYARAASVDRD